MVRVRSRTEIEDEIQEHYAGHHLFEWVRPRTVWFEATAPVYFDFGDDIDRLAHEVKEMKALPPVTKRKIGFHLGDDD